MSYHDKCWNRSIAKDLIQMTFGTFHSQSQTIFMNKICTLASPLLKGAELTLSVAKNVRIPLFETVPVLYFLLFSNGVTGFGSTETNDRVSGCTVLLLIEKLKIKLIYQKLLGIEKKCAWGCARRINTTWENLQVEKNKSGRRSLRYRCLFFFKSSLTIERPANV